MNLTPLYSITTSTPVGDLHLIVDRRQEGKKTTDVALASGFGSLRALRARLPEAYRKRPLETLVSHPYGDLVTRYFKGDKKALSKIDCEQEGTHFLCSVWEQMQQIPYGTVASYTDLAKASGSPRAVRAVGSACARNLLVLIVPCHRVVKTGGSLGNYAYGVKVKQFLLTHEQTT